MAIHKYAAVINAWAYGKEIQCKIKSGTTWIDYDRIDPKGATPAFSSTDIEWRIKPKVVKREGWVNIYKHYNSDDTWVSDIHHTKQSADSASRVVKSKRVDCARIEWFEEEV